MATEYGKVIAENRKRLGLTQAELGAKLNVTAQAVSKWENGNSEPDFSTIQRLTEIFGIGAEEFFGKKADAESAPPPPAAQPPVAQQQQPAPQPPVAQQPAAPQPVPAPAPAPQQPVTQQPVVPQPAPAPQVQKIIIGYCDYCKKPIAQGDKYHVYHPSKGGSSSTSCWACHLKHEKNRRIAEYNNERKNFRNSMIVATIVAVLAVIAGVVATVVTKNPLCLLAIAAAAGLFMFVAQCFWTSYALELLLFFCRSFRLPMVIFTLDLDGILWFITVKLALGILSGLLSVLLFAFGLLVSMLVGVVTFPFCLPREIRTLGDLRQKATTP